MLAYSKRMVRSFASMSMACVLIVGVGACGSKSDDSSAGVGSDKLSHDVGSTASDGETTSSDDKALPDGWPIEVLPVPDGFEIEKVVNAKRGDSGSRDWRPTLMIIGPNDLVPAALAAYAVRFDEAGYVLTENADESVTGEKRNGDGELIEMVVASASGAGGSTTLITLEWIVYSR